MSKQIKQIRFYQENDDRNYPDKQVNVHNLATGNVFANYMPVTQLGIQALPGTKFYLNNSYMPIIIGYTGLYELNINDLTEITAIRFDHESLIRINANSETYLFVDLVYNKEEET